MLTFLEAPGYRYHAPAVRPGQKLPLMVFLHGVGERGSNNESPLSYSFFRNEHSLFGTTTALQYPAHIVVPQAPADDLWVAVERWRDPVRMQPQPTACMAAVMKLIDDYAGREVVDADRLYLTGLSMGGFGVLDLAARQSRRFAAVLAVCGGGDLSQAGALAQTPIALVHGTQDSVVPVSHARRLAEVLGAAGTPAVYREYLEAGHAVWDRAFADPTLIAWLMRQHRRRDAADGHQ